MRNDFRRNHGKRNRWVLSMLSVALIVSMSLTTFSPMDVKRTTAVTNETAAANWEKTGDVVSKAVTVSKRSQKSLNKLAAMNAEQIGSTQINAGNAEFKVVNYGYDQLSEGQQKLYDDFSAAVKAYVQSDDFANKDYTTSDATYRSDAKHYAVVAMSKRISEYGCTDEESMQVYFTFRNNNPQYFWISTTYYRGADQLTVLLDRFFAQASTRNTIMDAMRTEVASLVSSAQKLGTNYEKLQFVHDAIVDKVEYAYNNAGQPESSIWAHSVAGVFVKYHHAETEYGVVCEGYSKTLQLVLSQLDIGNVYIVGTAGGGGHAWNAVQMDNGTYYYVDSTWDDNGADNNGGIIYTYFCAPRSYFESKHNAYKNTGVAMDARWLYKLPQAGNTLEYTYYARNHAYYEDVQDDDEAEALLVDTGARTQSEYMQVLCADYDTMRYVTRAWGSATYYECYGLGYVVIASTGKYAIKKPATAISITADTKVEKGGKLRLTAELPDGCDDKVKWSIEGTPMNYLSAVTGESVTATFNQLGQVKVTAATYGSDKTATCTVTVEDPNNTEGYSAIAWANGKTYIKKLQAPMNATLWSAAKRKLLKGKLGWIVLSSEKQLQFDKSTKALLTKQTTAEKKMASITSNGLLTAKLPGTYYIHAYDSGTIENGIAEQIVVEMKVSREEAQTKTVTLTPNIKPTNWYNANHKLQKGRILWIAKAQPTKIEFNEARRTLVTKTTASDKLIGTVNSKGVVSGKNAGTLYVYACDTGSMHVEEFIVKVKNAPSAVKLSKDPNSVAVSNLVKNMDLKVGGKSSALYVIGTYNKKKVDADTDYSISIPSKYKEYLEVVDESGSVITTVKDKGKIYIRAKDNETTAALSSPTKITVKVVNNQSKKTVNCIVNLSK